MAERVCSKCKTIKELTEDNYAHKRTGKKGFESFCKVCKKERDAKRYIKKRKQILEQKKRYYLKSKNKYRGTTKINCKVVRFEDGK